MGRLFGTDGVRGVANERITCELAMQIGRAAATVLSDHARRRPVFVVGMDTRISSDMLGCALTAGLCSVGADMYQLGVIPTPAVAFLVGKYKADAGVMISASHNSAEFNGIKIFSGDGYKLPDDLEEQIEAIVLDGEEKPVLRVGDDVGKVEVKTNAIKDYVDHLKSTIPVSLSGLSLAVDCANGSAAMTARRLFTELGADCHVLFDRPDGVNINAGCGSTHMEELQARVRAEGAHIGVAFDGDADRFLAVDEKGNLVDGDQIMAIVGKYMKEKGMLKGDTIVATVMSNLGFFKMGEREGIKIEQTKVGDRYVLERMQEIGASLGGEQSGHIIFLDEATTGDGLLSALHLLQVMADTKKPLSELAEVMQVMPQALVNAKVPTHKKDNYMDYQEIRDAIAALDEKFAGNGRVLIRPSGTEPLVRVMIEGQDQKEIDAEAKKLAELMQTTLL